MATIGVAYGNLVGLVLRLHRNARQGRTQALAAKALGAAHHSTVVRLEQGDACPTVEQLVLLGRYLGISHTEILTNADKLAAVLQWTGVFVAPSRALLRAGTDEYEPFDGDLYQLFLDAEPRRDIGEVITRHRLAPLDRIRSAFEALPTHAQRWPV